MPSPDPLPTDAPGKAVPMPAQDAGATPPDASTARLRRRAILCVLGSSACFTAAAALVKLVGDAVPTSEIVLFRSVVALLCMAPLLRRAGGWSALRTRQPWGHAWRLVAGLAGMFGSFYGYAHLPLATVTALGFAMPIFLAMLSVPLLGERVGPDRALATGAGLVGVLCVLRPWQTVDSVPAWPALVVIAGVVFWALSMISIRRMGQSGERNITIVLLFAGGGTVVSGLLSAPVWVTPAPEILAALLGVGLVSAAAQLLMTEGYRSGEATMLAPFEYGAILYTLLLGYLIWGEAPGPWEAAGILVLVCSGFYAWLREGRG